MSGLTGSVVEQAALAWLEAIGWRIAHGPDISPDGDPLTLAHSQRERESYSEVVLAQRLRDALARIVAQKRNRTIVRVIQNLATAVFLPI